MATSPELPADPGVADFDALQEDPARWIGVVAALGERYSCAPAVRAGEGSVLVALLGRDVDQQRVLAQARDTLQPHAVLEPPFERARKRRPAPRPRPPTHGAKRLRHGNR